MTTQAPGTPQDQPVTEEDLKRLGAKAADGVKIEPETEEEDAGLNAGVAIPEPSSELPPWAVLPVHRAFKPPRGVKLAAFLFRAEHNKDPNKGDRHCVVWDLTDREAALAYERTHGKGSRAMAELAKGMIRAIDGLVARWDTAAGPDSIAQLWEDIGPKHREMLQHYYAMTHSFTNKERTDFFSQCCVVKTVG